MNNYSNVCRRVNDLNLNIPELDFDKPICVGNDGSGIKVSNRGEWMRQKWKVRRGWIKAVITVDVESKKLLDIDVFEKRDSKPDVFERHIKTLIKKGARIRKGCGDGAHDKRKLFNTFEKNNMEHAIKIRSNASTKAKGSISRAREVRLFKKLGYEAWAKETEYGMRWATEGKFSCVKRKFGETVRSTKKNNMLEESRRKFIQYEHMMALCRSIKSSTTGRTARVTQQGILFESVTLILFGIIASSRCLLCLSDQKSFEVALFERI